MHNDEKSNSEDTKEFYTIDEAIECVGFGRFQVGLLFMCGMCWAADAMEMMLLSFLLPSAKEEFGLDSWLEATIGSVSFGGMMLGAYFWGSISDRFGRKIGFIATAVFTSVFGFASSWSPNYYVLIVARALVGFGLGGAPVAFSLFAEYLPAKNRGIPLVLFEVFWTVGTLGEAGAAWAILPTLGWRWLLGISTIPISLLILFYPLLPESPRYLAVSGKYDQAEAELKRMARINKKSLPPGKLLVTETKQNGRARFWDLFLPVCEELLYCFG